MEEIWKDIPGYEGRYQVSDMGRVRSLDRIITMPSRYGHPYQSPRKGRVLRPGRMTQGHMSVALGKHNSQTVHSLVMLAFIGPPPEGMEVCHNNGNPADNRLENLRYDSRSSNCIDAYRDGARSPYTKMTPDLVRTIRARLRNGEKGSIVARDYSVGQSVISNIKNGRTFAWVR